MDIDSIPAGRELDALIAEKVMNLTKSRWFSVCRYRHKTDDYEGYFWEDGIEEMGWCYTCGKSVENSEHIPPPYSTDISAAWEVLEKIRPISITKVSWMGEVMYEVRFCGPMMDKMTGKMTVAKSAPLAICLAALKAVEG